MSKCTRADHDALRNLPQGKWNELRHRKDWNFDDGEVLEQRDCPKCGSTLTRHKKGTENGTLQKR